MEKKRDRCVVACTAIPLSRGTWGPSGMDDGSAAREGVSTKFALIILCFFGHNQALSGHPFVKLECECDITATTHKNRGNMSCCALRASQFTAGNVAPTSGTIGDGYGDRGRAPLGGRRAAPIFTPLSVSHLSKLPHDFARPERDTIEIWRPFSR